MTKYLAIYLCLSIFFLLSSHEAHAIIFLPALLLIPIAKIVAIFIAGFSLPALGVSTIVSRLKGKPFLKTFIFTFSILLAIALVGGIVLKLINPLRPIF